MVPADRDRGLRRGDGSAAFFPLYPLASGSLAWLPGVRPAGRGAVHLQRCFLGALVMLHGLTRLEFSRARWPGRSVLLVAIFPTAFFFLAPYTESPFLLLSVVGLLVRAARPLGGRRPRRERSPR